jgi:hypothetical protein
VGKTYNGAFRAIFRGSRYLFDPYIFLTERGRARERGGELARGERESKSKSESESESKSDSSSESEREREREREKKSVADNISTPPGPKRKIRELHLKDWYCM